MKKNLSLITKVVVIWIHELFLANANIFSYKCILRLLIEGKGKRVNSYQFYVLIHSYSFFFNVPLESIKALISPLFKVGKYLN